MPTVASWRWMAKDTVTIEPFASKNSAGEATYGTAVTYQAHCQGDVKRITNAVGEEKISTVATYLIGAVALTILDRITLPARFSPRQPPIIEVGQHTSERAWHHTVVRS